jgi:hypothetical protein
MVRNTQIPGEEKGCSEDPTPKREKKYVYIET